ncbi:glucosyltransferase domain-containing protein [Komagataeibacter sp. NFXK3]
MIFPFEASKGNAASSCLLNKEFTIRSLLFFFVFLVFSYPIIHASVYYADDTPHTLYGIHWERDGRPLGQLLILLMGRFSIVDYAPLPQLFGLPFIAMALAAFSIRWGYSRVSSIICLSLIVCNPFFMENISYRFDSIIMEMAVFCSIMPFSIDLFIKRFDRKSIYLWKFSSIIACLNLYQSAINIYLSLILLTVVLSLIKKEDASKVLREAFYNVIILGLGLFAYKLETCVLPGGDHYADAHKEVVHSVAEIFKNIPDFSLVIAPALIKGVQSIIFSVILVLGCISLVLRVIRMLRKGDLTPASGALVIFCLAVLPLCIPGILLLLAHPVYAARVMTGFGAVCACFFTFLLGPAPSFRRHVSYIPCVLVGFGLWSEMTMSAAYANALAAQSRFRDQMAQAMVDDAVQLAREANLPDGESFWWSTRGNEPIAPLALRTLFKYQVLTDMVLPTEKPLLPSPWMMHSIMLAQGLPKNFPSTAREHDEGKWMWEALETDLQNCAIDGSREHGPFITYRIGAFLIADYDKSCVLHGNKYEHAPSTRTSVFRGRAIE